MTPERLEEIAYIVADELNPKLAEELHELATELRKYLDFMREAKAEIEAHLKVLRTNAEAGASAGEKPVSTQLAPDKCKHKILRTKTGQVCIKCGLGESF